MKHTIIRALTTAMFAGLLVLLTPLASFGDNRSFTLTVPARGGGKVPVGSVKIVLDLASDPGVGTTQLTIGSGADAEPVGFPDIVTLTNKDRVTFIPIPVAGMGFKVVILYEPRSLWDTDDDPATDDPPNRCVGETGAESKNILIQYEGPDIDAYRMSTYTVAKNLSIDAGPCDTASRRIQTEAASIGGPGTLDFSTFRGRLPLDVVLILDKSGSMGGLPPGASPGSDSKWLVLKEAINQFVDIWTDEGIDATQDRIGVVFFSSGGATEVVDLDPGSPSVFAARGADGAVSWLPVKNVFDGRSPGGSTAMGQGLDKGVRLYTFPRTAAENDVHFVLMTDGLQNVAPQLETLGNGNIKLTPLGDIVAPGTIQPCQDGLLSKCNMPVQGVAIGEPESGSMEYKLLDEVAKQTSGHAIVTKDAMETVNAFAGQLVEALKGNTLSILARKRDKLAPGVPASASTPVLLDGSVRRAIFVLGWQAGQTHPGLDLEIRKPDGGIFIPNAPHNNSRSTIRSVDIPKDGPIGNWSVRVVRKQVPPAPAVAAVITDSDLPYQLSVYIVEGKLDYRLSFSSLREGTGDTMVMMADMSYERKALTNLPNNAIKLKIERPNTGLGTLLHDKGVDPNVLATEIAGNGDVTTPYRRKLEDLSRNNQLTAAQLQELGDTFFLRDDGNAASGDAKANDGIYSARFADTSRPGLYRFKVTMEWENDPRTGSLRRVETLERVVKVNADAKASQVKTENLGGGKHNIRITPLDKFNNYFGPGGGNLIQVQVSGGGTITAIADPQETGDYIATLEGVPPGADPHITIVVDGKTITDADLSDLPGGESSSSGPKSKFSVFFHFGATFPHGNFNNLFDPGFSFNAGLEYAVTNHFSVEGIFGYHRFRGETFGPVSVSDLNLFQFSGNGKLYLTPPGAVRPWVNFGIGAYKFDPGSTRFGGNGGAGLQFNLTPKFALEAGYNFHAVSTPGSSTRFSTLQGGFRFRF